MKKTILTLALIGLTASIAQAQYHFWSGETSDTIRKLDLVNDCTVTVVTLPAPGIVSAYSGELLVIDHGRAAESDDGTLNTILDLSVVDANGKILVTGLKGVGAYVNADAPYVAVMEGEITFGGATVIEKLHFYNYDGELVCDVVLPKKLYGYADAFESPVVYNRFNQCYRIYGEDMYGTKERTVYEIDPSQSPAQLQEISGGLICSDDGKYSTLGKYGVDLYVNDEFVRKLEVHWSDRKKFYHSSQSTAWLKNRAAFVTGSLLYIVDEDRCVDLEKVLECVFAYYDRSLDCFYYINRNHQWTIVPVDDILKFDVR